MNRIELVRNLVRAGYKGLDITHRLNSTHPNGYGVGLGLGVAISQDTKPSDVSKHVMEERRKKKESKKEEKKKRITSVNIVRTKAGKRKGLKIVGPDDFVEENEDLTDDMASHLHALGVRPQSANELHISPEEKRLQREAQKKREKERKRKQKIWMGPDKIDEDSEDVIWKAVTSLQDPKKKWEMETKNGMKSHENMKDFVDLVANYYHQKQKKMNYNFFA